jgi:4-amino-4-deoxy-L-arabinose transferase-like glycosyltransferase
VNTFWRLWIFALVFKLVTAATLPFSNDEAYYWVWSNHLQLSYFDHPGMIAWLISLAHGLDPFGLRWPAILLGHASWIFWYKIFKNDLGERSLLWGLLMLLNPLAGWGSLLAIPDTPAVFFLALSFFAALRWTEESRPKWALLLGVALGLGFDSKYQIVLFVPAFLIFLAWTGGWRRLPPWQWGLALVAGFVFSHPVFYWNFTHGFESFAFQLGHGLSAEKRSLTWPLEYLASQVGLLFPTVFFAVLKPPRDHRQKFLYVSGWFTLAFFLITSFSARPEGNWPLLGYAPLLTLAGLRARPGVLRATVALWALLLAGVLSEAYIHWLPLTDKQEMKTSEADRFDAFIPYMTTDVPVYASSYQMAAALTFKTRHPIYKLKTLSRRDFYDDLPESEPPAKGRFLVFANRETDFSRTILKNYRFVEENHFTYDKKVMTFEVP